VIEASADQGAELLSFGLAACFGAWKESRLALGGGEVDHRLPHVLNCSFERAYAGPLPPSAEGAYADALLVVQNVKNTQASAPTRPASQTMESRNSKLSRFMQAMTKKVLDATNTD
jgi:hypothetical protein